MDHYSANCSLSVKRQRQDVSQGVELERHVFGENRHLATEEEMCVANEQKLLNNLQA